MAPKQLRRELGLVQVTIAGVGIILGAGIYALLGVAAGSAGNATWLAFLLSAVIALFTGLSYAELSSMFKGNAGEYDYIKTALNKHFAFFIALSMIVAGVISAATVSLGFAGYFKALIPLPIFFGSLLLIILMTVINFIGIKQTSWFNTVSTLIEFGGLILIIFLGWKYLGTVNYLDMPHGFSGVFSSTVLVFFAYMGFESIVKLREETKDPKHTIPKALIYSVIITGIIYVLVALSAVSIIGWEELSASEAPLATVAAAILGSNAFVILAIIALFSTANTVLITLVATSRMMYGMAKEKSLPSIFAAVHEKTRTPWAAITIISVFTVLFTLIGNIEIVANLTNLLLFLTFAAVNLSLLVFRYKCTQRTKRTFTCPVNIGKFSIIAFFGFLTSTFMFLFVLWNLITPLI